MFFLTPLLGCFAIFSISFAQECGRIYNQEYRIVGGIKIQNTLPWYGILYKKNKLICGSTLISSQYVITAAHCTYEIFPNPKHFKILFGAFDRCHWNNSYQIKNINKIIMYPNYNPQTSVHDISLLKLQNKVNLMPICLTPKDFQFNSPIGIIMGFGTLKYGDRKLPCKPHRAEINIYKAEDCNFLLQETMNINGIWNIVCAGEKNGSRDSCQGDSGGSLMVTSNNVYYILGVISAGIECGRPNLLGIYMNIQFYLKWIQENIK